MPACMHACTHTHTRTHTHKHTRTRTRTHTHTHARTHTDRHKVRCGSHWACALARGGACQGRGLPERLAAMGVTLVQWPVCGSYRSTEVSMFSPSYPPTHNKTGQHTHTQAITRVAYSHAFMSCLTLACKISMHLTTNK